MAATAVAVGAERAADSAARCLTPEMLEGALRHLHKPALDPALGRSLRGQRGLLEDVRQRAAQAASIDAAEAGGAPPGELADADHDGRHAHRRLGPDRGAHRRLQVLRHRDRGRLALGHPGVRPGPAGLRGVGRRRHRQRVRAASVRPGGGRRGRQRLQRAGRRDGGGLRHPGALLPATGLRRVGGVELGRHHGHLQLDRDRGAVPGLAAVRLGDPSTSRPPPSPAGTRNWCGSSWPSWCWSPWWSALALAVPRLRRLAAEKAASQGT